MSEETYSVFQLVRTRAVGLGRDSGRFPAWYLTVLSASVINVWMMHRLSPRMVTVTFDTFRRGHAHISNVPRTVSPGRYDGASCLDSSLNCNFMILPPPRVNDYNDARWHKGIRKMLVSYT